MEILQGTASNITGFAKQYGEELERRSQAEPTQEKTFLKLDGQPVEIVTSVPPHISENDAVSVTGKFCEGVFHAHSYQNESNGDSGNNEVVMKFLLGLVDPGIA